MKRIVTLIGITVCLTIPMRATAANEAISDAVNAVLDRARVAVRESKTPSLEKTAAGAIPEFLRQALSTVLVRVTTKTSVVEQERSLAERSSCFRYDLWLIEREIESVWRELDDAEARGDVIAIIKLQEVVTFLSTQYDELLAGGLQPERENASWHVPLASEIPDDPKNEESTFYDEEKPFCFFHSSYTPPTSAGYGCTLPELDRILTALPPEKSSLRQAVTRERAALARVQETVDDIGRAIAGLDRLQSSIDDIIEGASPKTASSSSSETAQGSSLSSDLPRAIAQPVQGCVEKTDDALLFRELRGPFSVDTNDWRLLRDFWQLRRNEGANRPLPEGLELSKTGAQFSDIDLTQARDAMRDFALKQAERESAAFAASVDPGLSLEDTFADLRAASSLLTKLGGSIDEGLPLFVRNFAYWLRRSCIDRTACDERLERILRFTFTPACFAYGNGEYKKATCEQPQWKKCLYGALHPGEDIPDEPGCGE